MQWSALSCLRPRGAPFRRYVKQGVAVPAWEEFNWGSRGLHYKVGGVIVAHFFWPNTMQVNLYGHDERNGLLLNVFHVLSPDPVDAAACAAVAAAVGDWTNGNYNNCWAENVSSDRVVVTDVTVLNSWQKELTVNAAGTLIGATVPSQNTLAVKKSTGLSGRAYRGDWYVWPPTISQLEVLDGNLFLESYRDTCVNQLNILISILNTAGYTLVVASQATGQITPVDAFVATDRLVDSQNRRGGGRGR
jgi:hypothetical protein